MFYIYYYVVFITLLRRDLEETTPRRGYGGKLSLCSKACVFRQSELFRCFRTLQSFQTSFSGALCLLCSPDSLNVTLCRTTSYLCYKHRIILNKIFLFEHENSNLNLYDNNIAVMFKHRYI